MENEKIELKEHSEFDKILNSLGELLKLSIEINKISEIKTRQLIGDLALIEKNERGNTRKRTNCFVEQCNYLISLISKNLIYSINYIDKL